MLDEGGGAAVRIASPQREGRRNGPVKRTARRTSGRGGSGPTVENDGLDRQHGAEVEAAPPTETPDSSKVANARSLKTG